MADAQTHRPLFVSGWPGTSGVVLSVPFTSLHPGQEIVVKVIEVRREVIERAPEIRTMFRG